MDQYELTVFDVYRVTDADEAPAIASNTSFDAITDDRIAIEENSSE